MPSAIKHDLELRSKGLVTILIESQGSNAEQLEGFLWRTFPDNRCFSCTNTNVPIPQSGGIPHAAVIGVDGTLLWVGNPAGTPKPVEEFVHAELEKVKKGWGPTPEARKVRAALFGKGDLAGALTLLEAVPEGELRTQLKAEIDARVAIAKKSVTELKEQGRWLEAQERAKDHLKAVGKHAEWQPEAAQMVAEFETEAAKAELALDKKLDKIEKQLRDKKGDGAPKALQALLKGDAGSKVGARAQRLLTALQTPPHGR
ncbi:MAG: hypothetical protein MUC36_01285 [Planctomycetes bacterium]|nr:hypothetical protein [Planctomycetota bacterium]